MYGRNSTWGLFGTIALILLVVGFVAWMSVQAELARQDLDSQYDSVSLRSTVAVSYASPDDGESIYLWRCIPLEKLQNHGVVELLDKDELFRYQIMPDYYRDLGIFYELIDERSMNVEVIEVFRSPADTVNFPIEHLGLIDLIEERPLVFRITEEDGVFEIVFVHQIQKICPQVPEEIPSLL